MFNQIWSVVDESLTSFENFFDQFADATSEVSLFAIKLSILGVQIKFEPLLQELDSVIVSVMEEVVLAVKNIPRIETKLFTSLVNEALYLNSMSLQDDRIAEGRYVRNIIAENLVAPQKHLQTYDKYKSLLTHKPEKRIDEFLRENHDLDEFETVKYMISKLTAVLYT